MYIRAWIFVSWVFQNGIFYIIGREEFNKESIFNSGIENHDDQNYIIAVKCIRE